MGFDIYGIEPKENTIEPKILGKDWQKLNDKQREQYFEAKELKRTPMITQRHTQESWKQ